MTGSTIHSQSEEESLSLLDEKTLSDLEADVAEAESERLFPSPSAFDLLLRPALRAVRPSHLRSTFLKMGWTLLPSFVQATLSKSGHRPTRIHPTAYLDGMRGLAALFVFFCHYSYTCYIITVGYGQGEPGRNTHFLQLPFIRLLYSGPPMVCVFFVISGYALSCKPLKQMRAQQWDALHNTMASSIFRRAFRLFLPTIISTFMVFCLLRLGFYEPTRALAANKALHRNVQEYHIVRLPTFKKQFYEWVEHMFNFMCAFNWSPFAGSTGYDLHLWTIPVEFRASLMLFLTLIGLSRLRPAMRISMLFGLWCYVFRKDRWEMLLFLCGMFYAELDLILQSRPSLGSLAPIAPLGGKGLSKDGICGKTVFWCTSAVVALYLMSQPDQFYESTPGWVWLTSKIPAWFSDKYRYWQIIGSMVFVQSVQRLPLLQKPFNTEVVQYFGKISYALYLMHGPVMHTIGYLVQAWAWRITGYETEWAYNCGFVLAAMINIPLVIWAADVFWRFVDAPSVKFARWVENQVVVEEQRQAPR